VGAEAGLRTPDPQPLGLRRGRAAGCARASPRLRAEAARGAASRSARDAAAGRRGVLGEPPERPGVNDPAFIDLLGEPRLRIEPAGLRQSLTFAFSSGGTQTELARALAEAKPGPSLWSGECFAEDLFLGPLIERCLWRGRGAPRSSASAGVRRYLLG